MSIPDPVTTGLVVGGVLKAAKYAEDFIAAVVGHPGESLGTILGSLGNRRLRNVEAIGSKSHLTLLNIGVQPQEVPLNILHPLLESASLQEDPTLQETWANLLANAADPRNQNPVSPVFHSILKELTSREVRFLEALYQRPYPFAGRAQFSPHLLQVLYRDAVGQDTWDGKGFSLSIEILIRNQVLVIQNATKPVDVADVMRRVPTGSLPRSIPIATEQQFYITELGMAFVRACQAPTPSAPAGDAASA